MQDFKQNAFVYIIESSSEKEKCLNLNEGQSLSRSLELAGIKCFYNFVETKENFYNKIYQMFEFTRQNELVPILHLSMHGIPDGIKIMDNYLIKWDELCNIINPIQKYLSCFSCDFLICMSSCYGIYAKQMAALNKGVIPFKFLVGSSDKIYLHDAAVAYITFYHLLFKGFCIDYCVEIMKLASNYRNFDRITGEQVQLEWNKNQEQISLQIAQELVKNLQRHLRQNQRI